MESIRAAQYLRMSTERQEYSLDCQSAGIAIYALKHGFDVCQTYSDEAKSGLDIGRRKGLSQLLQDVIGGKLRIQSCSGVRREPLGKVSRP